MLLKGFSGFSISIVLMVFEVPRLQDDHGGQNPCILRKIFETEVLEEERYHQQKKKKNL